MKSDIIKEKLIEEALQEIKIAIKCNVIVTRPINHMTSTWDQLHNLGTESTNLILDIRLTKNIRIITTLTS